MDTPPTLARLALVFVGAGLGGVLRHWVGGATQTLIRGWSAASWSFPVGTVVVNVSGCFAIGLLGTLLMGKEGLPAGAGAAAGGGEGTGATNEMWRLLLLVGLLGGYTTFSAFGRETLMLFHDGRLGAAAANVILSNVLGLAAVALGCWIAVGVMGTR